MPEVNFKDRTINFSEEDFQDFEHLTLSLTWLQGIMFFPEKYEHINDYACGALVRLLQITEASPQQWHDCALMDHNFTFMIGTRSQLAEEKFQACWGKQKKGYNLHEKGMITGKFFHLYIPWRKNKSAVYKAIEQNPLLLPNTRGIPFKKSTLEKTWRYFKHSSHYWAAYLDYYRHYKSDFFEDIWPGELHFQTALDRFVSFLQTAATAHYLLGDKRDPWAPGNEDFEVERPEKIWTALNSGKIYEPSGGQLIIRSLSLEEAIEAKILQQLDNGDLITSEAGIAFSLSSDELTIYKTIKKKF